MIVIMLLSGAAASAGPPQPVVRMPLTRSECRRSTNEIVVCGQGEQQRYRLRTPLPDEPPLFPKAELSIGGARIVIETEAGNVGGSPSNRMMVRVKFKF